MKTRLLTAGDIREIGRTVGVDQLMDDLIDRLERACRQYDPATTTAPPRSGFHYQVPVTGLVEWMPIHTLGEPTVLKVVAYHPANPGERNLPTILSTISAYDASTGHLIGLMDGVLVTALRTGAASAVASRVLARPDSRVLGLVGCGAQAITQLHALSRVFELDTVLFFDTDPGAAHSFVERASCLGLRTVRFERAPVEAVVSRSDLLCVQTTVPVGEGPVFDDLATREHLHVNAVGSDFPGKTELPLALLRKSLVCPDFRGQALVEGECQQLRYEVLGPELTQLVAEAERFHRFRERLTIFDSTGWALEDRVAADLFLQHAGVLGLGTEVEVELHSCEPQNPYSFLNHHAVSAARRA